MSKHLTILNQASKNTKTSRIGDFQDWHCTTPTNASGGTWTVSLKCGNSSSCIDRKLEKTGN